jgi:hypothetical protein
LTGDAHVARHGLQDYLIAEGSNGATARNKQVACNTKFFFSQDGVR